MVGSWFYCRTYLRDRHVDTHREIGTVIQVITSYFTIVNSRYLCYTEVNEQKTSHYRNCRPRERR